MSVRSSIELYSGYPRCRGKVKVAHQKPKSLIIGAQVMIDRGNFIYPLSCSFTTVGIFVFVGALASTVFPFFPLLSLFGNISDTKVKNLRYYHSEDYG